jgi:LPXTG-motif cell wall-anchored protein
VQIDYTDPQGERLTENKEVTIPSGNVGAFTPRQRTATTSNNNNLIYGIIVIIIIIAGIYLYRKRKQNSKKLEMTTPTESQPKQ